VGAGPAQQRRAVTLHTDTVVLMPELPEVETIASQLGRRLVGKRVAAVQALWPKSLVGREVAVESLVGRRITAVTRRGKVVIINFSGGVSVLVHLRMTGQLLYEETGARGKSRMTRALVNFDDGSRLVFNDQRKFGSMTAVPTSEITSDPLLSRMGPEPLGRDFNAAVLKAALSRHPHQAVKATLLDQTTVAGIGNIYADEILFSSGIHPQTRSGDLNDAQVSRLAQSIADILAEGITAGGASMRDYVDADGEAGKYLDRARVFARTGLPCRVCGTAIVKTRVAGRGTHLCPVCQVEPLRE
jgi:formamidopyrimidine-DNA glycosylase